MPGKQSHNRGQFWKHCDVASNIKDLMKSIVTLKFSLGFSRFCRINMPEKQFHNRVQFQKHSDFASNNEHLMKSTIKFKSSLARRKRKISRFCKINMQGSNLIIEFSF